MPIKSDVMMMLLAGLETCDKVGEERITLACRFVSRVSDNIVKLS